jgi:hypothetical protein
MTSRQPSPPNRRRIDRISGSVLAVLGIAVAVVALIALRHPNGRQAKPVSLRTSTSTVTATPPTSTKTVTKTPKPPPSHPSTSSNSSTATGHPIPLVVLNSTSTTGLAETAKQRFEQGGWTVTGTNNIVNDILSTCAYYDPNTPGAQQAAEQLQQQFPAIKRVKEKFAELPPGPIVVVLTSDYS